MWRARTLAEDVSRWETKYQDFLKYFCFYSPNPVLPSRQKLSAEVWELAGGLGGEVSGSEENLQLSPGVLVSLDRR